jgi:lysyl-tRNA synthetase class 2
MAPCLHALPEKMTDERRTQHRVEDLLVNKDSRDIIIARATVIRAVREFFEDRGFTEVQTPILASQATGASATPFMTSSKALGNEQVPAELFLRIAPELWLKRMIVAGFDRVFEVGPCFRNEGIDATHNPEFTTCEFYQAYATLSDLIETTQNLLALVFRRVSDKIPGFGNKELLTAFESPATTMNFIETIENRTGKPLPADLSNSETLLAYFHSLGIEAPLEVVSAAKLLDHLASIYIEPLCNGPTYITHHPAVMSPLAKSSILTINGKQRLVSQRFELFISGREYVNAYEEENSPFSQQQKFSQQLIDREKFHDTEAPVPDASYVRALEYGLPPTGGWGLGIDRLCMLVTGSPRINQVLSFGGIKAVNYQQ